MARTSGNPAHGRFSDFRCEEGTITDINRDTHVVRVATRHSGKEPEDIQVSVLYATAEGDYAGVMPEVGATCHIAFPSDNTPPYIMDFIVEPSVVGSTGDGPARMSADPEGSPTDVSYRANRPQMNPGDQVYITRDGNHLILRRGGVVEIGATSISKRLFLPIGNYIKDFCENYNMHAFGGALEWTTAREEDDPAGRAATTWSLSLNEFAQDSKASVRVRHMPLAAPGGGTKSAWEVDVAPAGIDPDTGDVTGAVYHLVVTLEGDKIEVIGASREVTIEGDDSLTINGSRATSVGGTDDLDVDGNLTLTSGGTASMDGASGVVLGGQDASEPPILGHAFMQWIASAQFIVAGTVAQISPASLAQLPRAFSEKLRIK